MIADIHYNRVKGWNDIHQFYLQESEKYPADKLHHALDIFHEVFGISFKKINQPDLIKLLEQSVSTAEWITQGIGVPEKKTISTHFVKWSMRIRRKWIRSWVNSMTTVLLKHRKTLFAEYQFSVEI